MSEASPPSFTYEDYMDFPSPVEEPWDIPQVQEYLLALGAPVATVTPADIRNVHRYYDQSPNNRYYHGPPHRKMVGQPHLPEPLWPQSAEEAYDPSACRLSNRVTQRWAEATLAVAGNFHDAAYKHVDAIDSRGTRAWPTVLARNIGGFARYERRIEDDQVVYRTFLTRDGEKDAVTQMVAQVFGFTDLQAGIGHKQGGNEFDSALAAAKFLESKGVPAKAILAVTAEIAATVPFRAALTRDGQGRIVNDGYMNELANRVSRTRLFNYEPDWQDVNDIMLLSVHLANRDIAPFIRPGNVGEVIHNGRGVKREENDILRQEVKSMPQLVKASRRLSSAPLLYEWFGTGTGPLPAANVPHVYMPRDHYGNIIHPHCVYPPLPVYQEAVKNAETNSRLSSLFFKAHEAGIALAASIATAIGDPNARVPGFVYSKEWSDDGMPSPWRDLSAEESIVFNELMWGAGQSAIDRATPARSPIGAMLLGAMGTKGIEQLSHHIIGIYDQAAVIGVADPFSNLEIAKGFMRHVAKEENIGYANFWKIVLELQNVANYYIDDPELGGGLRRVQALGSLTLT